MAMPDFDSVDDYLKAQTDEVAQVLNNARAAIRKAIPKAEESVTYKIPTYKIDGVAVIFFAAWKKHWSLYPASELVTKTCKRELAPYEVQKGTIKFPYDAPPPAALLAKIAKLRAGEVVARSKAKAPKKKKASKKKKALKKKASKAANAS